jgi:hypothetical protein
MRIEHRAEPDVVIEKVEEDEQARTGANQQDRF